MKKRWTNRLPETGVIHLPPADGGTDEIDDAQAHKGEVSLDTSHNVCLAFLKSL